MTNVTVPGRLFSRDGDYLFSEESIGDSLPLDLLQGRVYVFSTNFI